LFFFKKNVKTTKKVGRERTTRGEEVSSSKTGWYKKVGDMQMKMGRVFEIRVIDEKKKKKTNVVVGLKMSCNEMVGIVQC